MSKVDGVNSKLSMEETPYPSGPKAVTGDGGKHIVATRLQGNRIVEVKLSDDSVLGIDEAIKLAEKGGLSGVTVGATRYSNRSKTLRSWPDGDSSNNLRNLPRF